MEIKIIYHYALEISGKSLEDQKGTIYFETNSLANLPSIGDSIDFESSEDGPSGSFKIVDRYIEWFSMDVNQGARVIMYVEEAS